MRTPWISASPLCLGLRSSRAHSYKESDNFHLDVIPFHPFVACGQTPGTKHNGHSLHGSPLCVCLTCVGRACRELADNAGFEAHGAVRRATQKPWGVCVGRSRDARTLQCNA